MKRKHFFILFFCCISHIVVFGQENLTYLQRANESFETGNYEKAKQQYKAYVATGGKQDVGKRISDSELCLKLRNEGDQFFAAKDYKQAAKQYYELLTLNPKDKHATSRNSEIKKTASIEYQKDGYYIGAFNYNGKRHGQGSYFWNDGNSYEGQWVNGERAGQGILHYANGQSENGRTENGTWIADKTKATLPKTETKNSFGAMGYMFSPTAPVGMLFGGCGNRWGGYGSFKTHLLDKNHNVSNVTNLDVNFDNYKHFRWSISGGGIYRLFKQCYLYGGLGYGEYGKAYTINNYSNKDAYHLPEYQGGLDIECGVIYSFDKWYLSAGYNTLTAPQQIQDFSVGIGMCIK